MSILPKANYRFNAIPMKIPMIFFTEMDKNVLKFVWSPKWPQIFKIIMRKKNKAGGTILPDCKVYYNSIVNKTVWYWHTIRLIDQLNRIESPEINTHMYNILTFTWETRTLSEERISSQTVLG